MDLDYNNIYNCIYNYLIDKDIIIIDNDYNNDSNNSNILINKLKYYLLKYKRIIAIILFIILLIIGYHCDLHYLDIDLYQSKIVNHENIIKNEKNISGGMRPFKSKLVSKASAKTSSALKSGAKLARSALKLKNINSFAEQRAADAKEFAPKFYAFIYSVALTAIGFLIFMPAIGFLIVGIICYSLLKKKIGYIKNL